MSLQWSLLPIFLLASVLLALGRQPGNRAPWAGIAFAGLFFTLGVLGLEAQIGWAAAWGTGVAYLLVGLPLASVCVAMLRRLGPQIKKPNGVSTMLMHAG